MKKIISISIVLVLVTGAAFAQFADGISVQAWGRAAFSPLSATTPEKANGEVVKDSDGDDVKGEAFAGVRASWGGDSPRVDFRINGNSEFVGFSIHSNSESGDLASGDNGANIWAKPFGSDILKITVGTFIEDTLRGKIGNLDGGFSNFVLSGTPEEDAIFGRFGAGGTNVGNDNGAPNSFLISLAPVDGLFIGLMVNGMLDPWWNGALGGATVAANAYRYMQLGFGYNIEGIGHARAQYVGGWSGTVDPTDKDVWKYFEHYENVADPWDPADWQPKNEAGKLARIELAFALTAVENLLVDLGAKIWLPLEIKDKVKYSNGFDLSLGANYNGGSFGIGARVDITGMGAYAGGKGVKDDDSEDGMMLKVRLVPTFNLDFATIGLDVAFHVQGEGKDGKGDAMEGSGYTQIGFGAFIQKGLGNGSIKAGLSYTLAPTDSKDNKAWGSDIFQIPIILEYAFF